MFDESADAYEPMIDWPKRLANEEGLFRWVFDQCSAKSVLDAACGTGHHAAMFHSWSLSVQGADLSASMIGRCESRWGRSENLRWVVRGFDQLALENFDVAICIGNSLALVPDHQTLDMVVGRLLDAVRPGGAVLLHVLNLWALPEDGQVIWQKCFRATLPAGERIIIKGVQRLGDRGQVHMLITPVEPPTTLQVQGAPFLGVEADRLERSCCAGGAKRVQLFGNYQRGPYERDRSIDLIAVAWK